MARFRNTGGTHTAKEPDPKRPGKFKFVDYPHGAIIDTDKNLDVMFPNHFDRLPDLAPLAPLAAAVMSPPPAAPQAADAGQPGADSGAVDSPLGKDVTTEFGPQAYDHGALVFMKAAGKYFVTTVADPDDTVNPEGKPVKKSDVAAIIASMPKEALPE